MNSDHFWIMFIVQFEGQKHFVFRLHAFVFCQVPCFSSYLQDCGSLHPSDYIFTRLLACKLCIVRKFNLLNIFKFCEECHVLRCDAEWSDRSILTSQKNLLPLS